MTTRGGMEGGMVHMVPGLSHPGPNMRTASGSKAIGESVRFDSESCAPLMGSIPFPGEWKRNSSKTGRNSSASFGGGGGEPERNETVEIAVGDVLTDTTPPLFRCSEFLSLRKDESLVQMGVLLLLLSWLALFLTLAQVSPSRVQSRPRRAAQHTPWEASRPGARDKQGWKLSW